VEMSTTQRTLDLAESLTVQVCIDDTWCLGELHSWTQSDRDDEWLALVSYDASHAPSGAPHRIVSGWKEAVVPLGHVRRAREPRTP
jgi:hypothetical protein